MVGWFYWVEGQRQVEVISLLGVPILKVGWSMPRRLGEKDWNKQIMKGVAFLKSHGCRRVLYPSGMPYGDKLLGYGIHCVDTAPLYRHLAGRIAVTHLVGQGTDLRSATVKLQGERVDRAMHRAAYGLCPRVRTMMIEATHGGLELAMRLQNQFGVALLKEGNPDITLVFSGSLSMPIQPATLFFTREKIFLDGYRLGWTGIDLPPEVEESFWIALLWEGKKIFSHEIEIIPSI